MKKIIFSATFIVLLASSCTKQLKSSSKQLNTPLLSALPTQYISVDYIGKDGNNPQLIVDLASYKHGEDCDKKVFDATNPST